VLRHGIFKKNIKNGRVHVQQLQALIQQYDLSD
jgi:hypothetical protein